MVEAILPGTYITVRDEGLISAGQVVSGNIGIVGTAAQGPVDEVQILGSFSEAKEIFGDIDPARQLTLIQALEQIYNNGGKTVYAVRTAATKAASYQIKDSSDKNLVKLEAKTPGTWGNNIKITISDADSRSLVTEELKELKGDAQELKLNRSNIDPQSKRNAIAVKQKSTGLLLCYDIVYDQEPENTKPQVKINKNTGALTFTQLTGFAPIDGDTIMATYEVPAANSKKVELIYQTTKETYTIADAAHLAEQVNSRTKGSILVTATLPNDPLFNQLPRNTSDSGEKFGTGLHGHTAGSDGEPASAKEYKNSLAQLENELINLVLLAGQDVTNPEMATVLQGHLNATATIKRERIGIIGSGTSDEVNTIAGHTLDSDRLILVAPGLQISPQVKLSGAYTAAAVAGLMASLPVQASPTNKPLTIPGLAKEFSTSQLEKLVGNRVLAIQKQEGFRVVKGITTATNSAWHQITTRRIVDFAIYGVRSACNPYIGKLNNERVRGAMKATLDAFLTRMVQDEALISYELAVTANRVQEIAGEAIVTMTLRPTFSIDFIKVTMYLG